MTWTASTFAAADVINKAIAYEEAWNAYAHRDLREADLVDLTLAKGRAHQALLEAIRALREEQP